MQLQELVKRVCEQLKGLASHATMDVALASDGGVALNESRTVCRVNFTVRVETPNSVVSANSVCSLTPDTARKDKFGP